MPYPPACSLAGAGDRVHPPINTHGSSSSCDTRSLCFVLFVDAVALQQLRLDLSAVTSATGSGGADAPDTATAAAAAGPVTADAVAVGTTEADVALNETQDMRFGLWRLVLVRGFTELQSRAAARV